MLKLYILLLTACALAAPGSVTDEVGIQKRDPYDARGKTCTTYCYSGLQSNQPTMSDCYTLASNIESMLSSSIFSGSILWFFMYLARYGTTPWNTAAGLEQGPYPGGTCTVRFHNQWTDTIETSPYDLVSYSVYPYYNTITNNL